ncbi:MAG TPA: DUF433 domain-containing protein [Solirubrobacterales bacterium]|jgi:uncharacterized protein (DUF433 family)|nr:DUF433 domain-containing protein [Solirubrobacterales bacterium]
MAQERITVDPNRMRSLPRIRDTRVTASAVLGQLAAGTSVEELLANYPYLEREMFSPSSNMQQPLLRSASWQS